MYFQSQKELIIKSQIKMEKNTIKALFVNGGPRKNKNTAQMLLRAMQGAQEADAEVELVHLYDIDYKGCKSCFACQLKNARTDGVCAIRDNLRPLLEKAREADVIVIGSPVYFSYPTGETRSFLERLIFPNLPTTTTRRATAADLSARNRRL